VLGEVGPRGLCPG